MSDEKGIYVSVSTHVKGPVYDQFVAAIEAQIKDWIESSEGKAVISDAIKKAVNDQIRGVFSYGVHDEPKFKKFTDAVRRACLDTLLAKVERP